MLSFPITPMEVDFSATLSNINIPGEYVNTRSMIDRLALNAVQYDKEGSAVNDKFFSQLSLSHGQSFSNLDGNSSPLDDAFDQDNDSIGATVAVSPKPRQRRTRKKNKTASLTPPEPPVQEDYAEVRKRLPGFLFERPQGMPDRVYQKRQQERRQQEVINEQRRRINHQQQLLDHHGVGNASYGAPGHGPMNPAGYGMPDYRAENRAGYNQGPYQRQCAFPQKDLQQQVNQPGSDLHHEFQEFQVWRRLQPQQQHIQGSPVNQQQRFPQPALPNDVLPTTMLYQPQRPCVTTPPETPPKEYSPHPSSSPWAPDHSVHHGLEHQPRLFSNNGSLNSLTRPAGVLKRAPSASAAKGKAGLLSLTRQPSQARTHALSSKLQGHGGYAASYNGNTAHFVDQTNHFADAVDSGFGILDNAAPFVGSAAGFDESRGRIFGSSAFNSSSSTNSRSTTQGATASIPPPTKNDRSSQFGPGRSAMKARSQHHSSIPASCFPGEPFDITAAQRLQIIEYTRRHGVAPPVSDAFSKQWGKCRIIILEDGRGFLVKEEILGPVSDATEAQSDSQRQEHREVTMLPISPVFTKALSSTQTQPAGEGAAFTAAPGPNNDLDGLVVPSHGNIPSLRKLTAEEEEILGSDFTFDEFLHDVFPGFDTPPPTNGDIVDPALANATCTVLSSHVPANAIQRSSRYNAASDLPFSSTDLEPALEPQPTWSSDLGEKSVADDQVTADVSSQLGETFPRVTGEASNEVAEPFGEEFSEPEQEYRERTNAWLDSHPGSNCGKNVEDEDEDEEEEDDSLF